MEVYKTICAIITIVCLSIAIIMFITALIYKLVKKKKMKINKERLAKKLAETAAKEGKLQEFVNKLSALTGQPIPPEVQYKIDMINEQYKGEQNNDDNRNN